MSAILKNGIIEISEGSTNWRIILNQNLNNLDPNRIFTTTDILTETPNGERFLFDTTTTKLYEDTGLVFNLIGGGKFTDLEDTPNSYLPEYRGMNVEVALDSDTLVFKKKTTPELAKINKSFLLDEEYTIDLNDTVENPNVSVQFEKPLSGLINYDWNIGVGESDYDVEDFAYDETISLSGTTGEITITKATAWVEADIGKVIAGNGGSAILAQVDGLSKVYVNFNDTSDILTGDWSLTALNFKETGVEINKDEILGDTYDYDTLSTATELIDIENKIFSCVLVNGNIATVTRGGANDLLCLNVVNPNDNTSVINNLYLTATGVSVPYDILSLPNGNAVIIYRNIDETDYLKAMLIDSSGVVLNNEIVKNNNITVNVKLSLLSDGNIGVSRLTSTNYDIIYSVISSTTLVTTITDVVLDTYLTDTISVSNWGTKLVLMSRRRNQEIITYLIYDENGTNYTETTVLGAIEDLNIHDSIVLGDFLYCVYVDNADNYLDINKIDLINGGGTVVRLVTGTDAINLGLSIQANSELLMVSYSIYGSSKVESKIIDTNLNVLDTTILKSGTNEANVQIIYDNINNILYPTFTSYNPWSTFYYNSYKKSLTQFAPKNQILSAVTNATGQLNTINWTDINAMLAFETKNNQEIFYSFSIDNKTTLTIAKTTEGFRNIVKFDGVWKLNGDFTYGAETWFDAGVNTLFGALSEALSAFDVNRMDKTQMEAMTDEESFATGATLDCAISLRTNNDTETPISDGIQINYDGEIVYRGAVETIHYETYQNGDNSKVQFKSLGDNNLRIRII